MTLLAQSIPRTALAQTATSVQSADDEKRKGDEAMVALRYAEALEHYHRAYDANHNPALLYNMGRAYEGLGDFPKALDALEQFAAKASPELKARVPKLDQLVSDVRGRVCTLVVSSTVPDADIRLGEKVVGQTTSGQLTLRVSAGKQHLTISREGYFPFEKDLPLEGGKVETVDVRLASRSQQAILRIDSPVRGASAAVDGQAIGVVPTETMLSPGSHKIALERDGYSRAETSVILTAGEHKNIDVPLDERHAITSKWWFWTTVGAVVVAGAVITIVAITTEKDADHGSIAPGQVRAENFGLRF